MLDLGSFIFRLIIGLVIQLPLMVCMLFITWFVILFDAVTDLTGKNKHSIFDEE